jgi:hypothetical protein
MRGSTTQQIPMLSTLTPEQLVPPDHSRYRQRHGDCGVSLPRVASTRGPLFKVREDRRVDALRSVLSPAPMSPRHLGSREGWGSAIARPMSGRDGGAPRDPPRRGRPASLDMGPQGAAPSRRMPIDRPNSAALVKRARVRSPRTSGNEGEDIRGPRNATGRSAQSEGRALFPTAYGPQVPSAAGR